MSPIRKLAKQTYTYPNLIRLFRL